MPWDASTALLSIHAATGATVSFAPGAGDGPFYMNDDLDLDASLTATAEPGLGIFANVPAGTYTVTASHPGSTCAPDAWPSADGGG